MFNFSSAIYKFWCPLFIACNSRFISNFGTHIVVGVKMGGKDVVYVRQQHSSSLQPVEVQKRLKELADRRFLDVNRPYDLNSKEGYGQDKVFLIDYKTKNSSSVVLFSLSFKLMSVNTV